MKSIVLIGGGANFCYCFFCKKEINFYAPATSFKEIVYTSEFMLADIMVDGSTYRCILKDLQFHKVTDELIHLDFLELIEDKKVIANLPLKFVGTPEGVRAGGKLVTKMKSIKVKSYPRFLKEYIEVDIKDLQLNANIRVQDVNAPNMEILNPPRIPVASVVLTRQLKQEESAAPAAGAAAPAAAAAAKK